MSCQQCSKDRPIVNKRYKLCTQCNHQRLYGDDYKTKGEIQVEKKKEFYKEMDSDVENGFCKGCGTTQTLTHSHLISVSRNKDLESNPLNVVYHCLINHCHSNFESNNYDLMSKMLDFEENLNKIEELDKKYWYSLLEKLGIRKCTKCNKYLKLEFFKFNNWWCNDCRLNYYNKYNNENSERRKLYMRIYNSKNSKVKYNYSKLSYDKFIVIHSDYIAVDWERQYKGMHEKIDIICPVHGLFQKTPNELIYKNMGCPLCTSNKVEGEEVVKEILELKDIKYVREESFFNREDYPTCWNFNKSSPLYFDFFLEELNLIIEVDDITHKYNKKTQFNDKIKEEFCIINEISLVRIPFMNHEDKILIKDRLYYILENE